MKKRKGRPVNNVKCASVSDDTEHLLSSKANAEHLKESIKQADEGKVSTIDLKDLDFVEVLQNVPVEQNEKKVNKEDFFSLAGIWEDRDITAGELRAKAWPRKP